MHTISYDHAIFNFIKPTKQHADLIGPFLINVRYDDAVSSIWTNH